MKAAFIELFGEATGPEETLFKFMKHAWTSLDFISYSPPRHQRFQESTALMHLHSTVLSFICSCLKPENDDFLPRGDYKKFLELAKFFLVEKLSRSRD